MPYYGSPWRKYVPVAARRQNANRSMQRLRQEGVNFQPVNISGRQIVTTFWGKAWCKHFESLHDFENRLPRGRTYVRNGSVCHLEITQGRINAMVSGSMLYSVEVDIDTLAQKLWKQLKRECAGKIGSLIELLQGRFSDSVMKVVTNQQTGLFPTDDEIHLSCDCPDWAYLCKHLAAVLYGVGARLDQQPELLFLLRGVNHEELIDPSAEDFLSHSTQRGSKRPRLSENELADTFGIEMQSEEPTRNTRSRKAAKPTNGRRKKTTSTKKAVVTTKKKKVSKKSTKAKSPKKTTKKSPQKAAKKRTTKKKVTKKNPTKPKAATRKKTSSQSKPKKKTTKRATTVKRAAKKKAPARKKN